MVSAPFRRVRETRRELNAKVTTRPTPHARDASARLLDGTRPALGARVIEPPTCIGNRANWPCAMHAQLRECTQLFGGQRSTADHYRDGVTRHQFQITPHLAERSDGHIADR